MPTLSFAKVDSSCSRSLLLEKALFPIDAQFRWKKFLQRVGLHKDILLGSGRFGDVYLSRVGGDEPLFVKKRYKKMSSLKTDQIMLKYLHSVLAKTNNPFRVITSLDVDERTLELKLEYLEGRTVHDLILDPKIKDDIKIEIIDQYMANLKHLFAQLKDLRGIKYFDQTGNANSYSDNKEDNLPAIFGSNLSELFNGANLNEHLSEDDIYFISEAKHSGLFIKSDNVLVSPFRDSLGQIQLTIIDPF